MNAMMREAARGRLWRWPVVLGLALALVFATFHDLPALAGTGGTDPLPVASASTPFEAPADACVPAASCHCLCHTAAQAIVAADCIPVLFELSVCSPRDSMPPGARAGLPPFRPPRA
jgi:hypothetical protein